jgi:hypothetical protein
MWTTKHSITATKGNKSAVALKGLEFTQSEAFVAFDGTWAIDYEPQTQELLASNELDDSCNSKRSFWPW